MARESDIKAAFMAAMRREQGLSIIVTTQEFVRHVERLDWHFSLREANQRIKSNTVTFRDASTQEGESKTYRRFKQNGGI